MNPEFRHRFSLTTMALALGTTLCLLITLDSSPKSNTQSQSQIPDELIRSARVAAAQSASIDADRKPELGTTPELVRIAIAPSPEEFETIVSRLKSNDLQVVTATLSELPRTERWLVPLYIGLLDKRASE